MKILIVEDSADDRKILRMNLERHGCEVIDAGDGEEGLNMAKKYKPDLIISDALMPKMDGFQLLRTLKRDENLKKIPFIFYSAVYTGYKEAELAISLGAEEFIIKPKEPEELWNELNSIVEECRYKKEKPITARLIQEEEEFLRKYSHVVASKLEEKVRELENALKKQKQAEETLKQRLSFENTVCKISSQFVGNFDANASINEALAAIGRLSGAGRSYVFLMGDNKSFFQNTHEWCADGVQPVIDMAQNLPLDMFPWWTKKLIKKEVINIEDVSKMPPEAENEKRELQRQGVKAVLVFPLFRQKELGGFVGFDNIVGRWKWSDDDLALLRMFSEIIGSALERKQAEKEIKERMDELQRFYEMAVTRELKMKELKEEKAKLKADLEKYKKD